MRTLIVALLLAAGCASPTAPDPNVEVSGKYVSVGDAPHHEWVFRQLESGQTLVMGYYRHGETVHVYVGEVVIRGRAVGWHDFVGVHHDNNALIGAWRGYALRLERPEEDR